MILVSGNIPDACVKTLSSLGFGVKKLPPFSRLAAPVSSHFDMLIFPLGDKLLTHRAYYEENGSFFDGLGLPFVLSDEPFSGVYPRDILFNALDCGNGTLLSNTEYTSSFLKNAYPSLVGVKQGYTRCSCAQVGKGFITADKGIAKALERLGVPSLLITPGSVALPGYGYGFIGGASLRLDGHTTAFFGDISTHPDADKIFAFAKDLGVTLVNLSDSFLTDVGGGWRTL